MSIRLTVDNNFFDNYDKCSNTKTKERLISVFKGKRISFYPTIELISELLGLYHTKRRHLLIKYVRLCLEIIDYRFFNQWNNIILSEIGILKNKDVFLTGGIVKQIKNTLKAIANNRKPDNLENILRYVVLERDKNYKKYKENQEYHFKKFKKLKVRVPKMSFDTFFNESFAVNIRRDNIKAIFERAKKNISDAEVNKINDNKKRYPYFYISSRIFMALFYRHIVLKRKVKEGDHYDQYHLIYTTNLDYLISNDKGLKELATDVFGDPDKVISFDKLVNLL